MGVRTVLGFVLICTVGLPAQSPEAAAEMQKARRLAAGGRIEEAIPIYERLVKAYPNEPSMRTNLAIVQFKAGRFREAVEQSEYALKLQPGLLTAKLFLGASYLKLGEPAKAAGPLREVVEAQPGERNARVMLAEALFSLERIGEALEQFHVASKLAPENPAIWYGLGRCYESLSLRAFAQLDRVAPASAYRWALAGDSYLRQKRYGAAFRDYRKATAEDPHLRGPYHGLARLYRETGHAEWASTVEVRRREIPLPKCDSGSLECDFLAGRYADVVQSAASTTPEAYYWQSKAYSELAEQAYSHLAALPPSLESHELAARTYAERGRHLEAAGEWREALKLSPGDPRILKGLALALYNGRDHEAALPALAELLKRNPRSAELNFLYGSSLLNLERLQEAIPFLQNALRHDPGFLPAHAALGQAYLRLRRPAEAIPHLKASLPADEDGQRRYQLARAYQLIGSRELARQAFEEYEAFRKSAEEKRRLEESLQIAGP